MKRTILFLLWCLPALVFAQAPTNTNTKQIRFLTVTTASDTTTAGTARMWYDYNTDVFRVMLEDGTKFTLGSGSGSGGGAFTINDQTASYQVELSDANNTLIRMDVAGANNLTIPPNSTEAFPIGSTITVESIDGQTTVVPGSGVTINSSAGNLFSPDDFSPFVLVQVATNEWDLWNGSPAVISEGDAGEVQVSDGNGGFDDSEVFALSGNIYLDDAGSLGLQLYKTGQILTLVRDLILSASDGIGGTGSDGWDVIINSGNANGSNPHAGGDILIEPGIQNTGGTDGNIIFETHDDTGTFFVNSGANEQCGLATLVGGTVTVNNTKVTANSFIFMNHRTTGGTIGVLTYTIVAGTSFTITSASGTDTSTVNWWIVEPN